MVPVIRDVPKLIWPWFIYVFVIVLVFIFVLFLINPMIPRTYVYGIFREFAKTEMSVKTLNWPQIESEHFIVKYKPVDQKIAHIVLKNAEDNYWPVVKNLGYYPKQKVQVIIYPTRASLSKSFGWDANESAMGVYWAGVIRILSPNQWIAKNSNQKMESVFAAKGPMAHEFTHLIVDYLTRGNYTRWFTEGIAQYNELSITGFKLPNDDKGVNEKLYALKDMDENFDNLPDQGLAYRQSLVAIEYLVKVYGPNKPKEIMIELGKGLSMDKAMEKSIGKNMDQFEKDWHSWLKDNMIEMN